MPGPMDVIQYEEIDHPSHYRPDGIEAIAVIEDWNLNFSLGSVVKYICRFNRKKLANPLDDLLKARWYLDRYIERVQGCLEPKAKTSATKEDLAKETGQAKDFTKTLEVDRGKITSNEYDFMMGISEELKKFVCVTMVSRADGVTTLTSYNLTSYEEKGIADDVALAFREAFRAMLREKKEQSNDT